MTGYLDNLSLMERMQSKYVYKSVEKQMLPKMCEIGVGHDTMLGAENKVINLALLFVVLMLS